jgi:hypothetical protein
MKRKESKDYSEELRKILQESDVAKQNQPLRDLAKEVGAQQPNSKGVEFRDEIVKNINHALQTLAMIEMCKTASRNFVIALIATLIAFGSAIAAWVAVCK